MDDAGDVHFAEKHDLLGDERTRDEIIRLVEPFRLEPRHVLRIGLQSRAGVVIGVAAGDNAGNGSGRGRRLFSGHRSDIRRA